MQKAIIQFKTVEVNGKTALTWSTAIDRKFLWGEATTKICSTPFHREEVEDIEIELKDGVAHFTLRNGSFMVKQSNVESYNESMQEGEQPILCPQDLVLQYLVDTFQFRACIDSTEEVLLDRKFFNKIVNPVVVALKPIVL